MDAQTAVAQMMTEHQLRDHIVTAARMLGWLCYFTWRSDHSPAGFPDLVLARPGRRVIFAELKSHAGQLSREQKRWLEVLRASDMDAFVWRPAAWLSGEIEEVLR